MVCQTCQAENRPGRKFCAQCGSALAAACPSCGAANQPGERFCGECGIALTGAPAFRAAASQAAVPPAAERRLVSVLFADLVGFTSLSDTRDPEDVRDLLTRYFETSREVVGRYGGTVDKFIGDAVVAVWGTPTAHEDDAERAVRAGFDLTDAVAALGKQLNGAPLALRAAVGSGQAAGVIGPAGQGMGAADPRKRARLICIVGQAGIGKSRLVWEFQKYLDGFVQDIYWHQGRSPAYGEGVTFWALGEMLRRRAGIAETDDSQTTRQRLEAAVAENVADHNERRRAPPRAAEYRGYGRTARGSGTGFTRSGEPADRHSGGRSPALCRRNRSHAAGRRPADGGGRTVPNRGQDRRLRRAGHPPRAYQCSIGCLASRRTFTPPGCGRSGSALHHRWTQRSSIPNRGDAQAEARFAGGARAAGLR